MPYYIAHATPRDTHKRPETYKTRLAARQTLKFIRANCVETRTPSTWMGDDCLQVMVGSDAHYYNILVQS